MGQEEMLIVEQLEAQLGQLNDQAADLPNLQQHKYTLTKEMEALVHQNENDEKIRRDYELAVEELDLQENDVDRQIDEAKQKIQFTQQQIQHKINQVDAQRQQHCLEAKNELAMISSKKSKILADIANTEKENKVLSLT